MQLNDTVCDFFQSKVWPEKGTQHSLVCSKSLVVWAGKKGASESGNVRNVYFSITCQWRFSSDLRNVKSDPSQDWAQSGFPSPREMWRNRVGGHHNCRTFVFGDRINFNVTHISFERPLATLTMNPRYKIGLFSLLQGGILSQKALLKSQASSKSSKCWVLTF